MGGSLRRGDDDEGLKDYRCRPSHIHIHTHRVSHAACTLCHIQQPLHANACESAKVVANRLSVTRRKCAQYKWGNGDGRRGREGALEVGSANDHTQQWQRQHAHVPAAEIFWRIVTVMGWQWAQRGWREEWACTQATQPVSIEARENKKNVSFGWHAVVKGLPIVAAPTATSTAYKMKHSYCTRAHVIRLLLVLLSIYTTYIHMQHAQDTPHFLLLLDMFA